MTKLGALAMLLAVAACTSVRATRFPAADRYAPVTAGEVRVFHSGADEPPCHVLLADLEGSGSVFNSREDMVESFRRKAAEIGANGLLLRGYDESSWAVQEKEGRALAIRSGEGVCEGEG